MTLDRIGAVSAILGSMILVGSALVARDARFRRAWWMAPAWIAILIVLVLAGLWMDSHG